MRWLTSAVVPGLMIKIRSEEFPLMLKPGASDPSMDTFFPSVNGPERSVMVCSFRSGEKVMVPSAHTAFNALRSDPGPLSAVFSTIITS